MGGAFCTTQERQAVVAVALIEDGENEMAKGKTGADKLLPLWQRLLLTLVGMVGVSFLAGLLWESLFNSSIPSYVSGIIGGLTALPIWEGLKRVRPKAG